MFIKLHSVKGNAYFINIDRISSISPYNEGSTLYKDKGEPYLVREAPEEIVELIELKESTDLSDLEDTIEDAVREAIEAVTISARVI